jgi:hypothetical protein
MLGKRKANTPLDKYDKNRGQKKTKIDVEDLIFQVQTMRHKLQNPRNR